MRLFLFCLLAGSVVCTLADETTEPALNLTVTIDGKPFAIELGRAETVAGKFSNPRILVQASPTRRFSHAGLTFDYPSAFAWEAEVEGPEYRTWTMSGNDTKIMYFSLDAKFTPEVYADSMVETFGKQSTVVKAFVRKFGDKQFKGVRVVATIGDTEIVQDAFPIDAPEGQWRLLVLQDAAPELAPDLEEPKQVCDLLNSTLKIGEE